MKLPDKNKSKKQKIKKKPITKPKKEKVLVVAQEFKFARLLSGNEKKTRDRVLKTFKKWLLNCFEKGYEFKEDDFVRVWKGLFYAVWMSDKPLVQEDLCESISEILDLFPANQFQYAVMMMKAGFKVLATEWYGIDQHRMDKFLMLVRRYLRGSFRCLRRCKWSIESCKLFSDMLCTEDGLLAIKTPQYARNATSMVLHVIDCYLEELSKISKGQIPDESLTVLMYPFSQQVCLGDGVISISSRRLLTALIKQSDLGLEYESVTRVWQKMGCPPGGPEALEAESDDEEDQPEDMDDDEMGNGEEVLDPRAGRVDVTLEPLPVPSPLLAEQLRGLMAASASRAFKRAKLCLERFEELSRNSYPLKVPAPFTAGLEPPLAAAEPMQAASRLSKLEKTLVNSSDELALRGLSRKHRKRLLARTRAGLSIVDDANDNTDSTNGDWLVETTKENKNNDTNKENKNKKKNRKRKHQKEDGEGENNKKPKTNESNQESSKKKKKESKNSEKKTEVNNVKQKTPENNVNKTKNVNKSNENKDKLTNGPNKQGLSANNKENKKNNKEKKKENKEAQEKKQTDKQPKFLVTKVKNYQKQVSPKKESPKKMKKDNQNKQMMMDTPKKVQEKKI
ncbi:unnamed protein product, partial [Brenthis ino]